MNPEKGGIEMKKLLLVGVAGVALVAIAPAHAADLPRPVDQASPPVAPPVPVFTWTGCYIGANIGGKWTQTSGSVDIAAANGPGGANPASSLFLEADHGSSFIGGGQVGCDYQAGAVVFGIAGDGDGQHWSTTRTVLASPPDLFAVGDTFKLSSQWEASLRGRIGYAADRLLFYATGGVAWTNVRLDTDFVPGVILPATVISDNKTLTGATVGGGVEFAIWNNLSFGLEGRFTWYGHHTVNSGLHATEFNSGEFTFAPVTTNVNLHTAEVLGTINWRFNWGKGKAPVVASY
jgi:outer membrane immunogenic protein